MRSMSSIEENKQTVVSYYTLAFNDRKPEEAVAQYVGSKYIQHNPKAPDGPDAFVQFVKGFAEQFLSCTSRSNESSLGAIS